MFRMELSVMPRPAALAARVLVFVLSSAVLAVEMVATKRDAAVEVAAVAVDAVEIVKLTALPVLWLLMTASAAAVEPLHLM